MGDELNGLDENVNDPKTDSDEVSVEEKLAQLEKENTELKKANNDDRSRLGRELKSYREANDERYNILLEKISELSSNVTGKSSNDDSDDDYELDDISDIKSIEKIVEKKLATVESNKAVMREKYVKDYSDTVRKLGADEEDEVYEAILAEMEGLPGYSNNGAEDAQRNYERAERNYYRRMFKSPKSTVLKQQPPAGKPGGASTVTYKETTDEDVASALKNEHVQDYMRRRGKDVEFVKKALVNKAPMSGTMRL